MGGRVEWLHRVIKPHVPSTIRNQVIRDYRPLDRLRLFIFILFYFIYFLFIYLFLFLFIFIIIIIFFYYLLFF